jgi:perosamine synthetase
MIPIYEPCLEGNEKKYVNKCLDSNWVSSQGEYIVKFQNALADYHGLDHAIVTSNCTTALHLSLKALCIGPGDEVLCPDLTFIAPANMVILSGAKLVLVDIHPESLTIDPDLIEEKITKNTKAIIVVHQFGHAAHMDEIMAIAKKYNIKVIEDNAESIGGKYKGRLLGTIADISVFSFFANKIITTGEGGAILTDNKDIAMKCRELRDHGMSINKKYYYVDLGFNYRMTNMQAAIGLAQIERLDKILTLRKKQMDHYYENFSDVNGIKLRQFALWTQPVHWLMTITLDRKYNRDQFLKYMKDEGIDCRQMINPVHQAEHFINEFKEDEYPNSIKISSQSVHLPSSTTLSQNQIVEVCESTRNYILEAGRINDL